MTKQEPALVVDRAGLARKIKNRPKAFVIYELLQNCWDENVTEVTVRTSHEKGVCYITVVDDAPEGFADLASIYTLFRDSKKADDPTKRGRFELGEKLVLSLAKTAKVTTTKGMIKFEGGQRTHYPGVKTSQGSIVYLELPMNRQDYLEMMLDVTLLIPPEGIKTVINELTLERRTPLHTFETTLQTVKADQEGNLTPTSRKTLVNVYETTSGPSHIYEMGIPVLEIDDKWSYDVQQRVPVNWERNSVPPSYLKTLRVEVLNAMHAYLSEQEATSTWVTDAAEDSRCSAEAIQHVVTKRFGPKAVSYDPSDPEGSKLAVSKGYTVIPGGAFSKETWANIRKARAVLPAGQVTPSPKPYDPNGHPERVIDRKEWTDDMWRLGDFAQEIFRRLTDQDCYTVIVNEPQVSWAANFGEGGPLGYRLCLNYGRLGKTWFARLKRDPEVLDLLLHEFCHHTVKDHLSHEMHEMATKLGARLTNLALDCPELFQET